MANFDIVQSASTMSNDSFIFEFSGGTLNAPNDIVINGQDNSEYIYEIPGQEIFTTFIS